MKKLCIYHGGCTDGFGAAWAVHHGLKDSGKEVEFYAGVHGDPPPPCKGMDVIIVDFSYKRDVMMQLIAEANSVTVIDHHKTAEAEIMPLINQSMISGVFDMDKSGARLAWEWFNRGKKAPGLILHIEDRDLWRFELPNTREIITALFTYEFDFDLWDKLNEDLDRLRDEGIILSKKHLDDVNSAIKSSSYRAKIADVSVPVLNAPYSWASDAGNIMSVGEPFAMIYTIKGDKVVCSLRSQEDGMDVSEIAKSYGGGGHKCAAGFSMTHEQFSIWMMRETNIV